MIPKLRQIFLMTYIYIYMYVCMYVFIYLIRNEDKFYWYKKERRMRGPSHKHTIPNQSRVYSTIMVQSYNIGHWLRKYIYMYSYIWSETKINFIDIRKREGWGVLLTNIQYLIKVEYTPLSWFKVIVSVIDSRGLEAYRLYISDWYRAIWKI